MVIVNNFKKNPTTKFKNFQFEFSNCKAGKDESTCDTFKENGALWTNVDQCGAPDY